MSINNSTISFLINEFDINERIDIFLTNKLANHSRSYVKKQIEQGNVFVNEKKVKANYMIKKNDYVEFIKNKEEKFTLIPQKMELNILHEDDDLLVVNKPKGIVVHPAHGNEQDTLVNGLLYYCKNDLSYIEEDNIRPGIVHRLDKDTSGLLVVAKNNKTHEDLKRQLEKYEIERIYNAIVFGIVKEEEFVLDQPIGRGRKDRKKQSIDYNNGRDSVTFIKLLQTYKDYSFVEAKLQTGRKHQIRVHLSSINHPVLGDIVYGRKKQPFNTQGQILHSKSIGFVHPLTKEYIFIESDLPDYFQRIVRIIEDN